MKADTALGRAAKRLRTGLAGLGAYVLAKRLYDRVAREPADRLPTDLDSVGEEGVDLLDSVAAHACSQVLYGNRAELLVNGDEIFPAMLEAIEAARQSVEFLTYVYWTGDIADRFARALARASKRGVAVRVLLDAYGGRKMPDVLLDRMEEAGCRVAWFHPFEWYNLRRLNYRTHRKALVVDNEIGFTGGVGIAEEWSGDARDANEWRDDHFRLEGPVVQALRGAFANNWLRATGEAIAPGDRGWYDPTRTDGRERPGKAVIVPLVTSPRGGVSPIAFLYWLAVKSTRSSVDIATPYFLPDDTLMEALQEAAARGVQVRLLVPGEHHDRPYVRLASYTRFDGLLDAGVAIHEFRTSMMHTKSVRVDERYSIIGSPNFDYRSFQLNDELALLVEDPDLNDALRRSFEADLKRSQQIAGPVLRKGHVARRAASRFCALLRRHL